MIPGGDDGRPLAVSPGKHAGFLRNVQIFDVDTDTWSSSTAVDTSRVTVPLVQHADVWFLCSGEEKPGIRPPEVWRVKLQSWVVKSAVIINPQFATVWRQ